MPVPLQVALTEAQRAELATVRDTAAKAYLRERAAGILKVAAGESARHVGRDGLAQVHRSETVAGWVRQYLAEGVAGLHIRPGRGRKPAFSPSGTGGSPYPSAGGGASSADRAGCATQSLAAD